VLGTHQNGRGPLRTISGFQQFKQNIFF